MPEPAAPEVVERRTHNSHLKTVVYAGESCIHGKGLFAARRITAGEYIGTFWGPEARRDGTYVLWVFDPENPDQAIGRSGRNMLRFLNHATRPNAAFDGFDLYANRAIAVGSEITIHYGNE